MDIDEVTYIGKSIGEHTIDLRVETIVKDNVILLDLLEKIKGMDGVGDVIWSEIVSVVGRKNLFPLQLLTNSDNHNILQINNEINFLVTRSLF